MTEQDHNWPQPPGTWPPVLTAAQVCLYLGLADGRSVDAARQALRRLHAHGLRSCGRIGSVVRYRKATIDAWLESREGAA